MVAAERNPKVTSGAARSIPVWRCHSCAIDRPRVESPQRSTVQRLAVPESDTGLYWSARGHVLCAEHATEVPSEDWAEGRWVAAPVRTRLPLQCEQCSPERTPVFHAPRASKV